MTPRRRLICITGEFFPQRGGIATYIESTLAAAPALGYSVELWAPAGLVEAAQASGQFPSIESFEPLPARGRQGWEERHRWLLALRSRRERLRGATVLLPEPCPLRAWGYLLAAGLPPHRLILALHGTEILTLARVPSRARLFGQVLSVAARIGVVSRFSRSLLQRHFPGHEERLVLAPGAPRQLPSLEHTGSNDGHLRVLCVGRVHPRKGQHALVEAAALLPASLRARLHVQLAGPVRREDYCARIVSLAARTGVAVEWFGSVSNDALAHLYAGADLLCVPSLPHPASVEGLGLSALEGSRAGLPVLAHRTGGLAEAVLDGQSGLLADPEDRRDLAAKLQILLQDSALRAQLTSTGSAHAGGFTPERTARALLAAPH